MKCELSPAFFNSFFFCTGLQWLRRCVLAIWRHDSKCFKIAANWILNSLDAMILFFLKKENNYLLCGKRHTITQHPVRHTLTLVPETQCEADINYTADSDTVMYISSALFSTVTSSSICLMRSHETVHGWVSLVLLRPGQGCCACRVQDIVPSMTTH